MLSEQELEKIRELNEAIKDLDPALKEKVIEYALARIFKDDERVGKKISSQKEPSVSQSESIPITDEQSELPTLKEFYEQKKPISATEIVTVFGFYLEKYRNVQSFSEQDIADAYYEARARKPKVIGQALRDAKNSKRFLVEGTKKGKFRISNIGENLVLHDLPRKEK